MVDIYAFLARGGWLMLPIVACSVAALAFFLERMWTLRRGRVLPPAFLERIRELMADRRFERAEELCRQTDSPLARMLLAGLERVGAERAELKEVVAEEGEREVYYMERFVGALGAIASISPLLGLLGTVIGMIDVFQDVVAQASGSGEVQTAALAGGIWQALITTASGLTVAIPTYLAYRYVLSRVDEYAVEMEEFALEMVDELRGDASGDGEEEVGAGDPSGSDAEEGDSAESEDSAEETDGGGES